MVNTKIKLISIFIVTATLFGTCGCVKNTEALSAESAVEIYLDNDDIWVEEYYNTTDYGYFFLDLDFDGVLEFVASLNEGSGYASTNRYFRIDPDSRKVEEIICDTDEKYDYLVMDTKLLRNVSDGRMFYYCEDYSRAGFAEYSITRGKMFLRDGKIHQEDTFMEDVNKKEVQDGIEEFTDYYYFAEGELLRITEEEYKTKNESFFTENTDLNLSFDIIDGRELAEGTEKVKRELLLDAYNSFSYDKAE